MAVGTIYTELDIDLTKFVAKQKTLVNQIQKVGKESELALQQAFMNLGVTSDGVYKLMAEKARISYEKIAQSGKVSAAEQVRAQQAMVSQINAINAKMTEGANAHYATLGMKSAASINEQIANVRKAAAAQQAIVGKSSEDWIRIERAKNAQLKTLNKEMTGEHEMSMAAMTRAVLRFYAAAYVVSTASRYFVIPFEKGFHAVETYNTAVAEMAAMVVTFSEKQKGVSLESQWKYALAYSSAMVPVLEKIAARTLLSGEQTTTLANAFARNRVFLDANNAAQLEGFARLSNALPLMTKGQEIMRQINTEVTALMSGSAQPSAMLLKNLKAIDPLIESHLKVWQQQGTVLEHIGDLLVGFGPATAMLENSWQAVKTTIDTTVTQSLRGAMKPAYQEIIKLVKELDEYLVKNQGNIKKWFEGWAGAAEAAKDSVKVAKNLWDIMMSGSPWKKEKEWEWGVGRQAPPPPPPKIEEDTEKAIAAAKLLERMSAQMEAFSLSGLEGPRKAFEQNRVEAEKLRKEFEKLPEAQKKVMYAEIAANQARKDAAIVNDMVQKSRENNAKAMSQERAATEKAKDAYDKLMNTVSPVTDRTYEMIEATKTISAVLGQGTPAWQEAIDKVKAYYEALDQKNTLTGFEKEAEDARKMVSFYNELNNMESEYRNAKLNWIEKEAALKKAKGADEITLAKWVAGERAKLDREQIDAIATKFDYDHRYVNQTITNTGKMLDAAMSMYNKESSEYKRMSDMKKGVQIAEMAMEAAKNVQMLSYMMAQNAAYAVAMTKKAASLQLTAAEAVLTQGTGDPYSAFARIATMMAIVASVLSAVGLATGVGGGSNASSAIMPSYGQDTSVLGGANGQLSESIANSYKLLESTYTMQDTKLTGIWDSMKELNQNITGLVNNILRNPNGFTGNNISSDGLLESVYNSISNKISGSDTLTMLTLGLNKLIMPGPVGSVLGSIFGGGSETTTQAAGISLGSTSVRNLLSGEGIRAMQYQDVMTRKKGGMFRSDKYNWDYPTQELDASTSMLFDNVFRKLGETIVQLSQDLGADTQKALDYTFAGVKINLLGLSADDISKKISGTISTISDKMVQELLGPIVSAYQQINEGLLETAVRLITNKEVVSNVLKITGQAFAGTTPQIIAFSESIVSMAGDLDKLKSAAQTYNDKFFTDAEKQSQLHAQLIGVFTSMNKILPETRAGYRAMVESLNLQNEADKKAYITMLQLADSADKYYTALGDVLDAQDKLTKSLLKQHETITQWLSDLNRSTLAPATSMESVQAEYNRLKGIANTAGASESDTSSYLNYAKEYLDYMRNYGGDYKTIYAGVVSDVQSLDAGINLQLDLAQKQLDALNLIVANTGNTVNAITTGVAASGGSGFTVETATPTGYYYTAQMGLTGSREYEVWRQPGWTDQQLLDTIAALGATKHASGGYANTPSIFGEAGGEWAVPTYEPQRKNFLKSAPKAFWDNLGLNGGSNGPGGDMIVHVHVEVDGKEIGQVVTKQIPRNGDLAGAIRRAAN